MPQVGRLKSTTHINIDEQVAITLYILVHHKKSQLIKFDFGSLGETVSRYFNNVILSILCLGVKVKIRWSKNSMKIEPDRTKKN